MRRLLLTLVATLMLPTSATAGANTLTATPSTFPSAYSSAQGGDTIKLTTGAYPAFKGASKSSRLTVQAADGATVTMAGATFAGTSNITLQGIRFTSGVTIRDNATGIVLDGDTFDGLGPATWEGRVSINLGAHDNIIKNSHFGGGGCSDGVFVGDAPNNTVGPGNEFAGVKQGSCSAHVDAIQLYDGPKTTIKGNFFHDDDTHIMAPDGGDHGVITDNVFVASGYEPTVQLGSHVGTQFVHNTVKGANIHMDSKTGSSASRDGILRDNVMVRAGTGAGFNTTNGNGCPTCVVSFNEFSAADDARGANALVGTPVFVGGTSPSSYAGFALAAGSPGKGNASDGADRGIRTAATLPPPPPPPVDTDSDGIPDTADACPTVPGAQPDGCPVPPPPPPDAPTCADVPECVTLKAQVADLNATLTTVRGQRDDYQARLNSALDKIAKALSALG